MSVGVHGNNHLRLQIMRFLPSVSSIVIYARRLRQSHNSLIITSVCRGLAACGLRVSRARSLSFHTVFDYPRVLLHLLERYPLLRVEHEELDIVRTRIADRQEFLLF